MATTSKHYKPNPARHLTDKERKQIETMAEMGLRPAHMGAILGFTKQYFYKLIQRDDATRLAYERGVANGTQTAVKYLVDNMKDGSEKSLHFWLKFMGGYGKDNDFEKWEELEAERLREKEQTNDLPSGFKLELIS